MALNWPVVTINPRVSGGEPLVGSARVRDLYDRIDAGDTVEDTAEDFDVPVGWLRELLTDEWRALIGRRSSFDNDHQEQGHA